MDDTVKWKFAMIPINNKSVIDIGDWCIENLNNYWGFRDIGKLLTSSTHTYSCLNWWDKRDDLKAKERMLYSTGYLVIISKHETDLMAIKLRWL